MILDAIKQIPGVGMLIDVIDKKDPSGGHAKKAIGLVGCTPGCGCLLLIVLIVFMLFGLQMCGGGLDQKGGLLDSLLSRLFPNSSQQSSFQQNSSQENSSLTNPDGCDTDGCHYPESY